MEHGLYVIANPEQAAAFSGLILPEIFSRLEEQPALFLIGAIEGNVPVGKTRYMEQAQTIFQNFNW